VLKDLTDPGEKVCVAEAGRGGKGNSNFATPTHQAPRFAIPGGKGQQRHLHLELKLIADVGLLGMPNAGKSTLISRLSSARPKIADYPFTTLEPVLGIVELPGERRFVMADIPGLIEGAHRGVGLGDAFLKHIERTNVLVHIIDILPPVGSAIENFRKINEELRQHSEQLAGKPQIVVVNKMDLTGADEAAEEFRRQTGAKIYPISAATGQGLKELTEILWRELHPKKS
jgi:GTPase